MEGRRRPWRRLQAELFRFATTDLHDLHVAIMSAFEEAAILQPAMAFEPVRAALEAAGWDEPVDDEQLHAALRSLTGWGLLDETQNHAARYATPEEFERRNLQWSLTANGEAAIGGVLHALASLGHAAALQTAVVEAIADGLGELRDLAADASAPAGRITTRLAEVEAHLASLVANVRQYNTSLQRLLREDGVDDSVFLDVKQRTVTYLHEYIEGVERPTRRVRLAIETLGHHGLESMFERALVGANLPPGPHGDPGPAWLAERHRHWEALCAWFTPANGGEPRIGALMAVARQAILHLVRVLERRWEARRRSVTVADEFRALGRLFGAAPDNATAHRLFNAAFGMWTARHAHLPCPDAEAVPTTASWLEAPTVEAAPVLRVGAAPAQLGRSRPVADPAALRARRQLEQAEAVARSRALRATLATNGAVRLSSAFRLLPSDAFGELLELLSQALGAPLASDGSRRAASMDGGVEIVLRHPNDGRTTSVSTQGGVLTAPDFLVAIVLTTATPGEPGPVALEAAGG